MMLASLGCGRTTESVLRYSLKRCYVVAMNSSRTRTSYAPRSATPSEGWMSGGGRSPHRRPGGIFRSQIATLHAVTPYPPGRGLSTANICQSSSWR